MILDLRTQVPLQNLVKPILKYINDTRGNRNYNTNLIEMFDGNLRYYVEQSLSQSMSGESFNIAKNNIVVINTLRKVIEKLSKAYTEPVAREAENSIDQELLEYYEDSTNVDRVMLKINEFFNLNKYCAIEPYIVNGNPRLRILTADEFCVYSDSPTDPNIPTVFIKFGGSARRYEAPEADASLVKIYYLYSVDQLLIVDSEGVIRVDLMFQEGLDGNNPLAYIPFIYVYDNSRKLIPTPDSDLWPMAIDTSVALTNLNYANLFMSHSLIYGVDLDTESLSKLKAAPNKFLNLKTDPSRRQSGGSGTVGAITPQINIPDTLQSIQEKIGLWLSSKGLQTQAAAGNVTAQNYASGIAKLIDEADAISLYKEQIIFFRHIEEAVWTMIMDIHSYWADIGAIDESRRFSDGFDPIIQFQIAEPTYSEDILVDILIKELETGLITRKGAIKRLNPEFTDREIDAYLREIRSELMSTRLDGAMSFVETARGMMEPMVAQEVASVAEENRDIREEEEL